MPATDQHTKTLEAADKVRRIVDAQEFDLLTAVREAIKHVENQPYEPPAQPTMRIWDCGCPPYGVCMNTACPRAFKVTC